MMKKDGAYRNSLREVASFVQGVNSGQEDTGGKSERYQSDVRDGE